MKIKNAFSKNFDLQGKKRNLSLKKFPFILKVAYSRVYTTGWLGILALTSFIIIINDNFKFIIFDSTMEFQIPLYQFFLNIAMGIFISFIFYFIVIHIETESKKSSVYLYLNNSIEDLDSKIKLLLYKINQNRHSNNQYTSFKNEDITQIF